MTSQTTTCLMCGQEASAVLCSRRCQRAAVRQRDRNVRRLRQLRRRGRGEAGAGLVARNAAITAALIAGRHAEAPVSDVSGADVSPADAS